MLGSLTKIRGVWAILSAGVVWWTFAQGAAFQPQPAAEAAPWQRVLTGDDAKRAAKLEQDLAELEAAGKYAEALAPARQLLALRTRGQGATLWQTADARRRIETLTRAAAMSVQDQKALATARQLHLEGFGLAEQGQYGRAERLHRQAVAIQQKVLGEEHPDTAWGYNEVAFNLSAQGKYAEAVAHLRHALAIRRKVLGEEHPDTATASNNLGFNLKAQGKSAEAEPWLRKALAIRQRVLGEDHPDTAQSYDNVAASLDDQGKPAAAEPLFRKALATWRKVLGDDHPLVAQGYNNVAMSLTGQGRFAEAEPLIQHALAVYRKARGEDHPDTATAYNNVASNLQAQDQYAQAEPYFRKALAIWRQTRGEEHPDTAGGCLNLTANLYAQGKYAAAELVDREALAICRKVLGEEHPLTAGSYHNLAANMHAQGKYAAAEPLFEKALAIRRKVLGEDHPNTARSYASLAANLADQGKHAEAEKQWRAAAKSFEAARLGVSFSGLERAPFAEHSPLPGLAACLAREKKAAEAWKYWEASLARGLLDDLSARQARPLNDAERRREQQLTAAMQLLDKQSTALAQLKELTDAQHQQLDGLRKEREALLLTVAEFEAELVRNHGPVAGQVYELAAIQKHLPADAALVGWLDLIVQAKTADPSGEHWACIVRQRGAPVWVKLAGSGPKGAWTTDGDELPGDEELPGHVRELLIEPPRRAAAPWRDLAGRLYAQRLAPLAPYLGATAELPAVRHLVVLPSPALAGVPVEALIEARTDKQPAYTVSYAPSSTLFAWLQEQRAKSHKTESPRLLALGDPVFTAPKKAASPLPPPPDHGVLLTQVVPGGNAAQGGLKENDVLLRYAGRKLEAPADLAAALAKSGGAEAIPVQAWRQGQTLDLTVRPGKLGVVISQQPAAEALHGQREFAALMQQSRGQPFARLPGTRREVEAIARLFERTDTLLGSRASEQQLDELVASGHLRDYSILHLATHGVLDTRFPYIPPSSWPRMLCPTRCSKCWLAGRRMTAG
jgi:tetratricopeptide (TPR) repeat protein